MTALCDHSRTGDICDVHGEQCPETTAVVKASTCADHTKAPSSYLGWHRWAEWKSKTHRQRRCAECGLWKIWESTT